MGKRSPKKVKNLLPRLCALALAGYLCVCLVMTQVEIVTQKQRLSALDSQLSQQQEMNDELNRLLSGGDEISYIERIARERLGYAAPDEKIYIDISGK